MNRWMILAFLLMLAAFVLITMGFAWSTEPLWWAGLAALALGGLIPAVRRFIPKHGENES